MLLQLFNGSSNRRGQSPALSRDPVFRGRTSISARDRLTRMPELNLTWPYRAEDSTWRRLAQVGTARS